MPRHLLILLISCLTALLGACDGSSSGLAIAPGGQSTVARPGSARLATLVTDATVEVLVDGERFGPEVRVGPDGTFRLAGVPTPSRVVVRVPGGPTLSAEVRGEARDWLWIGPITTMVSRYMQTHPDVSLEIASERVTRHLGIPAGVDIGSGLGDSHRSPFSWSLFAAAAGATPIDAFLDQQVALVDGGRPVSFRRPHPYPSLRAMLSGPQTQPGDAQVRAQGSAIGAFLSSVGGNILADVATDGISDLVGWVGEALGLNYGTSAQLKVIENDLNDITSELAALDLQVQNDFNTLSNAVAEDTTKEQIATIQGALGSVTTRIQSNLKLYQAMLAAVPVNVNQPFGAPPSTVTEFATSLHNYATASSFSLGDDISALRQSLLGLNNQPNLPMLYATLIQQALGNGSPQGSNLFCDLRSNLTLQREQDFLDFYRAYQGLALLLAAEASHLDNDTFSFGGPNANQMAANIQEATETLRQMSSDLVLEQQQVPPATLASDDVIVDRLQGVMYYNTLQYAEFGGDSGAFESSALFSLGPWGQGQWRLASQANLSALRSYALAAGDGDAVTGLQQMGYNLPGQTSTTDLTFLTAETSEENVGILFSMTTGSTSDTTVGTNYNYLMVRDAPGTTGTIQFQSYTAFTGQSPEDPATLRALAPPSALVPSAVLGNALDLVGTLTYTALVNVGIYQAILPPATETSTLDYTTSASWASSDTASLDISNLPGQQTQITYHTNSAGQTKVFATLLSHYLGQADGPPSPVNLTQTFTSSQLPGTPMTPVLTSILVTPNNRIYTVTSGSPASASAYCYATGFYSDGTVQDLTDLAAWSVVTSPIAGESLPQASASFDGLIPNLLRMSQSIGTSSMDITATYQGVTGTAQSETDFFE